METLKTFGKFVGISAFVAVLCVFGGLIAVIFAIPVIGVMSMFD